MLMESYTEQEVGDKVSNCDCSKSPGPDGFNFSFIKECWQIIKSDFMKMLEDFQQHGRLVQGLSSSFITLIPKREELISLNDYRHISLIGIGCVYKVFSKILVARLSKVLDN